MFSRDRDAQEFDSEIDLHLHMLQEEFIRRGMAPTEARSAARRQFGNIGVLRQTRRELSPFLFLLLDTLRQDIGFGLRALRRSPGFIVVAVLTLGLGIGANAAIFSVVKAVLIDPLPYAHANRLVLIGEPTADDPDHPGIPYTLMCEIAAHSHSLESISAYSDGPGVLMENNRPEMLRGLSVDFNFFDTLGVPVELGRNFRRSDQQPGKRLALILSHSLWEHRFGGDPQILGRILRISVYDVKVVGVLPPSFQPLLKATSSSVPEMYYPQAVDPFATCRNCQLLRFVGRLRTGVSLDQANMELNSIFGMMVRETPESYPRGARLSLEPLTSRLLGRASVALWAAWGAAGFVLLIACANIANLLLARAAGRTREMALRTALGAGRARLIRQLLTESLLLALGGGCVGTALASFGTGILASLAPEGIPRAHSAHIDAVVLGITLLITVTMGFLFGMAPAWQISRGDPTAGISGAGGIGRARNGLRHALMIAEIALAFVLALGAGLMVRTFWHLMAVGAGFDPHNVLTLTTSVISPRFAGHRVLYYREVLGRLRAVPGVEAAAMTSMIPLDHSDTEPLQIAEHPIADETHAPYTDLFSVSPDYFDAMRIRLKRGRVFRDQDDVTTPPVALINEICSRSEFPGEDPIGKHIKVAAMPWMTIVGVVGDVHQDGIDHPVDLQVYTPLNQQKRIGGGYRLVARTAGNPMRIERAIRSAFETVDIGSPVYHVEPLESFYSERLAARTFALALLALLGALAVALSAVGIYGVISYSVAQRRKEVGIRMALGAEHGQVVRLILRQAVPVITAGLAIGLAASVALARMLGALLFEVAPTDPATSMAVAGLLGSAALAATAIPARRAAKLDPVATLRYE